MAKLLAIAKEKGLEKQWDKIVHPWLKGMGKVYEEFKATEASRSGHSTAGCWTAASGTSPAPSAAVTPPLGGTVTPPAPGTPCARGAGT